MWISQNVTCWCTLSIYIVHLLYSWFSSAPEQYKSRDNDSFGRSHRVPGIDCVIQLALLWGIDLFLWSIGCSLLILFVIARFADSLFKRAVVISFKNWQKINWVAWQRWHESLVYSMAWLLIHMGLDLEHAVFQRNCSLPVPFRVSWILHCTSGAYIQVACTSYAFLPCCLVLRYKELVISGCLITFGLDRQTLRCHWSFALLHDAIIACASKLSCPGSELSTWRHVCLLQSFQPHAQMQRCNLLALIRWLIFGAVQISLIRFCHVWNQKRLLDINFCTVFVMHVI